jgi:hypothetical protein
MVDFEIAVGLPSLRPQSFWANSQMPNQAFADHGNM